MSLLLVARLEAVPPLVVPEALDEDGLVLEVAELEVVGAGDSDEDDVVDDGEVEVDGEVDVDGEVVVDGEVEVDGDVVVEADVDGSVPELADEVVPAVGVDIPSANAVPAMASEVSKTSVRMENSFQAVGETFATHRCNLRARSRDALDMA